MLLVVGLDLIFLNISQCLPMLYRQITGHCSMLLVVELDSIFLNISGSSVSMIPGYLTVHAENKVNNFILYTKIPMKYFDESIGTLI